VEVNQYVGRKVRLLWQDSWYEGVITDYRPETDEHCVTYNLNTPDEEYEWTDLKKLSANDFGWLEGKLTVAEMMPPYGGERKAPPRSRPSGAPRSRPRPGGGGNTTPRAGGASEGDKKLRAAGNDLSKLEEVKGEIEDAEERIRAELAALEEEEEEEAGGGGEGAGAPSGGFGLDPHGTDDEDDA